jgi:NADPH:quinone reductase-like Zn-dependent oxidoreductase
MAWQSIRISRFGGPEVLELVRPTEVPEPGAGEVRIKVLAAGTGFTDSFIRRGRYPDFKGPLPFVPGYEIVGVVEKTGAGVAAPREGELVADLCVVGGYAQHAIRPADWLVRVPEGVDPAEAVCIPLAYLTAFQMLTRYRRLAPGRRSWSSGLRARSARRCSISRGISASGRSGPARPRTSPRSSASARRRSTIAPTIS